MSPRAARLSSVIGLSSAIGLLVLLASGGVPIPAAGAPPSRIDPAPYMRQLARIGGDLRDIQATIDVRRSGRENPQPFTLRARIAARMPDSVRMDVIACSNPLIRGWKLARVGASARLYDPISERAVSMDVSKLTGQHPLRLDLGMDLLAGIFRPWNYTSSAVDRTTLEGKPAVRLRLVPRAGLIDPRTPVKVSYILVWIDPVRKTPIQQESYGTMPRRPFPRSPQARPGIERLATARFMSYRPAGGGVWYPAEVAVIRDRFRPRGRNVNDVVHLKLTRLANTLVPTEISSRGPDDSLDVRYSDVKVNAGLPDSTFRPGS